MSLLTREEYCLILQMAKRMGRRRTYLIMKTMANFGIQHRELEQLTVEALRNGSSWMTRRNLQHLVLFPEPLRSELLSYAREGGVETGLIFYSCHGAMGHSHIWRDVKEVCRHAGLSEDKGTPSSLVKLYRATYLEFSRADPLHADENFQAFLMDEEEHVAWSNSHV